MTDHKNLNYFMSKRLLNERQVRYSDILQQFNFSLKWQPGNTCKRPDALLRRDQDKPKGLDNKLLKYDVSWKAKYDIFMELTNLG